jgi:hypothetical protein
MLSMALWQTVSDRYDLLVATWDLGRAGKTELERLSILIWERLAPGAEALAVSPPELPEGTS